MCRLLGIVIAILLEKTAEKTSKNFSIPPSQTDRDETKKAQKKNRDTSAAENSMTAKNFETTTIEEVSTVEVCDSCGIDLSDIEPSAREQRVQRDIKYTVVNVKVDAEIKDCPECHARTKGRFPENIPGSVIPTWALFFVAHLSPIETFAKVDAMSELRSIENLPIIICCSFGRIVNRHSTESSFHRSIRTHCGREGKVGRSPRRASPIFSTQINPADRSVVA